MIVEPGCAACRARGQSVASHPRRISAGTVRAAIACAPHAPALLEARRLGRRLEHLGISERDVLRQRFALRRKAERGASGARDAAAAIDEGIEHDPEELVRELEPALLWAGRGLAGKLAQRIAQARAGEIVQVREIGWQRASIVEDTIDRTSDVLLISAEGGAAPKSRGQSQQDVGRGVAEVRGEV